MDAKELFDTADLALIDLSEEDAEKLEPAVSDMLEYFARMDELDVDHLEPTTHALLKHNRTREDVSSPQDAETLLENAPELEDRFVAIPNVL